MNSTDNDWNSTYYINTTIYDLHCPPELQNSCAEILFNSTEKALSIFILTFNTCGVLLIFYWLRLLWKAQRIKSYKAAIKVRRPSYLILSYVALCPWILVNAFDEVYLFWNDKKIWYEDENRWTSDGLPIYYTPAIDIILHFGFWFGFWAFFQLKIFKLWMLRYDYEYSMELNNMEWKENLGLRTVQGASFFIRYRGWLGNPLLMCFFQLVILIIIIFFQAMIRFLIDALFDSNEALLYEFYWVIFVLITELLSMVWLTHKIRSIEDNFFLKPESNRMFITYVVGIIIYGTSLSVWQVSGLLVPFIYMKLATLLCSTSLAVVYCYWETIWVLKRLKYEEKNASEIRRSMTKGTVKLRLTDVLSIKDGFEAMMRFLVKEFSCENLLCYVELTQYIEQWKPIPKVSIHNVVSVNSRSSNKVNLQKSESRKKIDIQRSSTNNIGDNSNLGLYNPEFHSFTFSFLFRFCFHFYFIFIFISFLFRFCSYDHLYQCSCKESSVSCSQL